jgi:hypothetical protein
MARRAKSAKSATDAAVSSAVAVAQAEAAPQTKFTDDRITMLVEALRIGMTRADACAAAGISNSTFCAWLRDARERPTESPWRGLPALVEQAEQVVVALAWNAVAAAAARGDLKAAEIILRRRKGYEERKAVEVTGADGGPVQVAATVALERLADRLRDLPDEALDAVAEGEDDAG